MYFRLNKKEWPLYTRCTQLILFLIMDVGKIQIKKNHFWSQTCYLITVIPEFGRQKDCHKFETSLDYMSETLFQTKKNKTNRQNSNCFCSRKQGQHMQFMGHIPFPPGKDLSQLNLQYPSLLHMASYKLKRWP